MTPLRIYKPPQPAPRARGTGEPYTTGEKVAYAIIGLVLLILACYNY